MVGNMSDIEKRLGADAQELERLRYSDEAQSQLQQRIAQTTQVRKKPISDKHNYNAWLMPAIAATLIIAVVLWLPPPNPAENVVPRITNVVPETSSLEMIPRPKLPPIKAVTYATPLEQEWQHIQDDLATTRDKIEKDLSVEF